MRKSVSSLIISSFLATIFIGSVLLMLPFSTTYGSINPADALFTSASAVTVTGLIVVDTATYFTPFGQLVILVLLQIGGLGFMTFSTFGILVMGESFSLKDRSIIENDFTVGSYKNIKELVVKIIVVTFGVELTGAILLYLKFTNLKGIHRVFSAIFHSISAFCNAGFSIFSNSFENYRSDWGVNVILMILIILGGIGFLVINEMGVFANFQFKKLRKHKNKKPFRFSLHSKLVTVSSGILILAGFLVIFLEELLNNQSNLDLGTNVLVSLFQSVSTRTAGFNTVNFNYLSSASLFVMILLMFIGASPGSTGGGIKTTSASVVVGYFRSQLRGIDRIDIFYRNIPAKTVEKAFIVILISFVLISFFFVLLLTLEPKKEMGDLLFETVSAFGTVGLSKGITSDLSILSKLVVSLTMFVGRIGPLTLLIALAKKESRAIRKYPEENIMIG
jgi:trk/ktr system potassium uptake protein